MIGIQQIFAKYFASSAQTHDRNIDGTAVANNIGNSTIVTTVISCFLNLHIYSLCNA